MMTDSSSRNAYRNPPPPSDDFQFETCIVKKKILTSFGDECIFMDQIDEEIFNTPWTDEDEPLTSSSSDDEVIIIEPPPKKISKEETLIQISKEKTTPLDKPEILSDNEPSSRHWKKEKKSKSPKSRRSAQYKKRSNRYSESSDEDESRYRSRRDTKPIKYEEPEERKPMAGVINNFDEYICEVCNMKLNSEVTMQTHMVGKRHQKALKARAIPEVAMQSLSLNKFEREPPRRDSPDRYPHPPPGIERITLNTESYIQAVAVQYHKGPLLGLSQVIEIRKLENEKNPAANEVAYYCKLCDSPCASISIMMHLTGFKHQLRFFETIEPRLYDKFRFASKRHIESRVLDYLASYERKHGRGIIVVQKEILEDTPREPQPGPSWRCDGPGVDMDFQDTDITSVEDLSTSHNDYHCIVCDSHMNNKSMWESHVRGKRHLKNKKKYPGDSASKLRSVPCPSEVAHLVHKLEDELVPIVGLEYIRETRGEAGDMYNCFLCGACTSEYSIMEHLKLTKHRIKYLETENRKGKANSIESILSLHDVSTFYKDSLIEEECRKMLEEHGSGRIEVYKSKVVIPTW